ncbi:hypothetical protein CHR26_12390 [Pseudomonas putida]|nr:hypothetical protein CHR26_12390 [Pseudomonas putida]
MIQSLFSLLAWRRAQVLETLGISAPLDSKVRQPRTEFKPFLKINFLLQMGLAGVATPSDVVSSRAWTRGLGRNGMCRVLREGAAMSVTQGWENGSVDLIFFLRVFSP